MPKIRKETSNRRKTNDRKKIQHKVRESRRKTKKAAKKNPQWKSKSPKDPGIPNNFPFKDQILAEVSEQRRIEAAEKLRKKEEKKALRAKFKAGTIEPGSEVEKGHEGDEEMDDVEPEELRGLQIGNDAVGGVGAKQLVNAKAFRQPPPLPTTSIPAKRVNEEVVPVLINHDLSNLQAVLDVSEVVIEVLDARDPLSFRSSHIEELVAARPGQHILLVLNKIDMCPRESVAAWAAHLRAYHPTIMFRSATHFLPTVSGDDMKVKGKGKATAGAGDGVGVDSVLSCLGEWARTKKSDEPMTAAVVGVTNVGKSSFINSLVRSNALPVYSLETSSRGPTTTEHCQEVLVEVAGQRIRLIDTPGLSWEKNDDDEAENVHEYRARDILLRSKGRIDRLKDPTSVVSHIISTVNDEDLMLLYNLPAFSPGDPTSCLSGIARSHQLVKKHGDLDLLAASRILLRDWNTGKLRRYTNPPKLPAVTSNESRETTLPKLSEEDEAALRSTQSRKELRKSTGLVKLISGTIDPRKVALEQPWMQGRGTRGNADDDDGSVDGENDKVLAESDSDASADGDEEKDGGASDGDQESDGGDDMKSSDEEHERAAAAGTAAQVSILKRQKRKRVMETAGTVKTKKVAFAPGPKGPKGVTSDKSPGKKDKNKGSTRLNAGHKNETKVAGRKVGNVSGQLARTRSRDETYNFGEFF